eukprot:CAMPEP_0119051986 /NCGR_PEP_ID=MMETSP1177-20130426/73426_1 /TAXON_ID=2985 /ORGANISM="Ochromonas sp, Strain CCMP1899" /LENGTH=216 /DNA_ID=CAMNT_0007031393 /DNA_START=2467 /DNA_END=3117 /DNA_ORIENTATION=-
MKKEFLNNDDIDSNDYSKDMYDLNQEGYKDEEEDPYANYTIKNEKKKPARDFFTDENEVDENAVDLYDTNFNNEKPEGFHTVNDIHRFGGVHENNLSTSPKRSPEYLKPGTNQTPVNPFGDPLNPTGRAPVNPMDRVPLNPHMDPSPLIPKIQAPLNRDQRGADLKDSYDDEDDLNAAYIRNKDHQIKKPNPPSQGTVKVDPLRSFTKSKKSYSPY